MGDGPLTANILRGEQWTLLLAAAFLGSLLSAEIVVVSAQPRRVRSTSTPPDEGWTTLHHVRQCGQESRNLSHKYLLNFQDMNLPHALKEVVPESASPLEWSSTTKIQTAQYTVDVPNVVSKGQSAVEFQTKQPTFQRGEIEQEHTQESECEMTLEGKVRLLQVRRGKNIVTSDCFAESIVYKERWEFQDTDTHVHGVGHKKGHFNLSASNASQNALGVLSNLTRVVFRASCGF